jgi:hypothetical protein
LVSQLEFNKVYEFKELKCRCIPATPGDTAAQIFQKYDQLTMKMGKLSDDLSWYCEVVKDLSTFNLKTLYLKVNCSACFGSAADNQWTELRKQKILVHDSSFLICDNCGLSLEVPELKQAPMIPTPDSGEVIDFFIRNYEEEQSELNSGDIVLNNLIRDSNTRL